jgi:hypothetical protein
VETELGFLHEVAAELTALHAEVGAGRDADLRVRALAGAFLQQFYNGVENVLKRLAQAHGVVLPEGERYHRDLLDAFAEPTIPPLPTLLSTDLHEALDRYRKFRHVARHAYSLHLDWDRLAEGAEQAQTLLSSFEARVRDVLDVPGR